MGSGETAARPCAREAALLSGRCFLDAVVMGAGTLRSVPSHLWTAAYIYPALASVYQELRMRLRKPHPPLNMIITARGEIASHWPVFQSRQVPVLLVTTATGRQHIHERTFPDGVQVRAAGEGTTLGAQAILEAVCQVAPCETILVEGGPRWTGDCFTERRLDEWFLTLAPQAAERDNRIVHPGLVAGARFAPERPVWGTLVGVKRGDSHLFLC
jgi:riboflavin biosynthesis pyrimidine reductase